MVTISMEASMVSPVGDGVFLAISANVGVPSLLYKTLFSLLGVSEVTFFSDVSAISDLVFVFVVAIFTIVLLVLDHRHWSGGCGRMVDRSAPLIIVILYVGWYRCLDWLNRLHVPMRRTLAGRNVGVV